MARSRMIRPEFWDDEKMAQLSTGARLTYIAMWCYSDDYGVVKGHAVWLKNHIFPYDNGIAINDVSDWLKELQSIKRILPFIDSGECYFYMPKFLKHQTINRPSKSRNPEPPDDISSNSCATHAPLIEYSKKCTDETETETETETEFKQKEKRARAKSWPVDFGLNDSMKKYAVENGIDPKRVDSFFEDFKNWAISKGAVYKDWTAAFRTRVNKAPEYGKQFMAKTENCMRVNWNE